MGINACGRNRRSYINDDGELTYAADKFYAVLVQNKDAEGRVLKEYYLDTDEKPTDCYGYFGISYEHREKEDIITYLDENGNPTNTTSGFAVVVRSYNEKGQAQDDFFICKVAEGDVAVATATGDNATDV